MVKDLGAAVVGAINLAKEVAVISQRSTCSIRKREMDSGCVSRKNVHSFLGGCRRAPIENREAVEPERSLLWKNSRVNVWC